ncbi:hypothetical protein C8J57DRAFT_1225858 [Mycena rebaudengoi]|nr:hypothetical protein C8J57DRAFT_1225858 [Mycena rebaudengoi]
MAARMFVISTRIGARGVFGGAANQRVVACGAACAGDGAGHEGCGGGDVDSKAAAGVGGDSAGGAGRKRRVVGSRSIWLAQAELSTFSCVPRVLPRTIYLLHQFAFHTLGGDYNALNWRYKLGIGDAKTKGWSSMPTAPRRGLAWAVALRDAAPTTRSPPHAGSIEASVPRALDEEALSALRTRTTCPCRYARTMGTMLRNGGGLGRVACGERARAGGGLSWGTRWKGRGGRGGQVSGGGGGAVRRYIGGGDFG